MTEEERRAAAKGYPDGRPDRPADLALMSRVPRVKSLRRALELTLEEVSFEGLTLEEFSERFSIPLGVLRDWEEGRTEPDAAGRAYLRVIASAPEVVRRALAEPAPLARGCRLPRRGRSSVS